MSKNFYFTYGSDKHMPFIGGWTQVTAPNREAAVQLFRTIHPDRTPNIVNCSFIYSEDEFVKTSMYKHGNYGKRCQETIALQHKVMNNNLPACEQYLLFNIMRVRPSENEMWFTQIYMGFPDGATPEKPLHQEDAKNLLIERVQSYLASSAGWKEICETSMDFNWGDLALLLPVHSVKLYGTPPADAVCAGTFDLTVNQDELLAPASVPGELTLSKDANLLLKVKCEVDMRTGDILLFSNKPKECSRATEGYVTLENGNVIACDPEQMFLTLKTAT